MLFLLKKDCIKAERIFLESPVSGRTVLSRDRQEETLDKLIWLSHIQGFKVLSKQSNSISAQPIQINTIQRLFS